jgi:hypothetical protein
MRSITNETMEKSPNQQSCLVPALVASVSGSLQEIASAVRPERCNFQQGLPSKLASTVIA